MDILLVTSLVTIGYTAYSMSFISNKTKKTKKWKKR